MAFPCTGHVATGGRWIGGGCIALKDDVETSWGKQVYVARSALDILSTISMGGFKQHCCLEQILHAAREECRQ